MKRLKLLTFGYLGFRKGKTYDENSVMQKGALSAKECSEIWPYEWKEIKNHLTALPPTKTKD